jgi:hypothetical protein
LNINFKRAFWLSQLGCSVNNVFVGCEECGTLGTRIKVLLDTTVLRRCEVSLYVVSQHLDNVMASWRLHDVAVSPGLKIVAIHFVTTLGKLLVRHALS